MDGRFALSIATRRCSCPLPSPEPQLTLGPCPARNEGTRLTGVRRTVPNRRPRLPSPAWSRDCIGRGRGARVKGRSLLFRHADSWRHPSGRWRRAAALAKQIGWTTLAVSLCVALTVAPVSSAGALPIGHSVDTLWTWPESADGVWRVEQEVVVESVTEGVEYFWGEHVWWVDGYSLGGYLGLQSRGLRRADDSIGDTAIFSVWEAIDARGPACGPFVEVTTGFSCSLAYPFRRGDPYRYVLERTTGDDTGAWWAASIVDIERADVSRIGEIKVRAPALGVDSTANFTEYFGPQQHSCASQPYALAHFGSPRAPGGVGPSGSQSEVSDPDCRVTNAADGRVTHEVGDPARAPRPDAPSPDDGTAPMAPDGEPQTPATVRAGDGIASERTPADSAANPGSDKRADSTSAVLQSGDGKAAPRVRGTTASLHSSGNPTGASRQRPPSTTPADQDDPVSQPATASNATTAPSLGGSTTDLFLKAIATATLLFACIGLVSRALSRNKHDRGASQRERRVLSPPQA